jgi:AcrR family transcriptional regulator
LENDRKSHIIKAAVKRFSKHGLGKTTLDEIARDLRIGKATIYHYFDSKEALFFRSIEWEGEQFIEDVKLIFENEELSLRDKFIAYFCSKENIDQKYKLLYEICILLMKDDHFEKEKEILKSIFDKEELIIETILSQVYKGKEKISPSFPKMFVVYSWGALFGGKLNQITNIDGETNSKELLNLTLEKIFPEQN